MVTFEFKEIKEKKIIDALCDAVKKSMNLNIDWIKDSRYNYKHIEIYEEGYMIRKTDGYWSLIEPDGTLFENEEGRTEFDWITRHKDGSTKIEINRKWSLIEKDGTTFKDEEGRTEFRWIKRNPDGSTGILRDEKWSLIEKDGTLFKDEKGRTEFDFFVTVERL